MDIHHLAKLEPEEAFPELLNMSKHYIAREVYTPDDTAYDRKRKSEPFYCDDEVRGLELVWRAMLALGWTDKVIEAASERKHESLVEQLADLKAAKDEDLVVHVFGDNGDWEIAIVPDAPTPSDVAYVPSS